MDKLIEIALDEYGVTEIKGKKHNPRIIKYAKDIDHSWISTDETAWCSIFANWIAMKAGYLKSDKLNARSWLDIGEETNTPSKGDVVILWRESVDSWKGHVGFFIRFSEDCKHIYILGGNQNNKVCIKRYPASRLLGFRVIRK